MLSSLGSKGSETCPGSMDARSLPRLLVGSRKSGILPPPDKLLRRSVALTELGLVTLAASSKLLSTSPNPTVKKRLS